MAILTATEVRAAVGKPLEDAGRYTDTLLADLVTEFTEVAENYRGCAFEPSTVTNETHYVTRATSCLPLRHVLVTTVSSLTVNGTAAGTYNVNQQAGVVFLPLAAADIVVVSYTHGMAEPPSALLRACREYVRSCALADRTNVPRDVIAQSFGDGSYTRFSTPDVRAGRPTGWLEVDRLLNSLPDYRVGMA